MYYAETLFIFLVKKKKYNVITCKHWTGTGAINNQTLLSNTKVGNNFKRIK